MKTLYSLMENIEFMQRKVTHSILNKQVLSWFYLVNVYTRLDFTKMTWDKR